MQHVYMESVFILHLKSKLSEAFCVAIDNAALTPGRCKHSRRERSKTSWKKQQWGYTQEFYRWLGDEVWSGGSERHPYPQVKNSTMCTSSVRQGSEQEEYSWSHAWARASQISSRDMPESAPWGDAGFQALTHLPQKFLCREPGLDCVTYEMLSSEKSELTNPLSCTNLRSSAGCCCCENHVGRNSGNWNKGNTE